MKIKNNQVPILLYPSLIMGFVCLALLYIFGEPASYVWVMDWDSPSNIGHVIKMCPNGHRLLQVQLGVTGGIGIDPRDGTIWAPKFYEQGTVLDQVVKIGADGTILNRYSGYRAGTVAAMDPKDGGAWFIVWIADTGHLVKFNSQGKPIANIGNFEYPYPSSMAINPLDDSIWVADGSNTDRGALIHLDSNGLKLFSIETNGYFPSWAPQVAVDPIDGDVWYEDLHSEFYKLSADGQLLVKVKGLTHPTSLTVNPTDGTVWIADANSDYSSGALVKLNSQGEIIRRVILQSRPFLVEINPYDESVWVGTWSKMIKLSADGKILRQVNGFKTPQSIAFAPTSSDFMTKLICAFYFYF